MISAPVSMRAKLFYPTCLIKLSNVDLGASLLCFLVNHEMAVSEPGDLRLMRHAQNLICLRELLQFDPDGFANSSADTGIRSRQTQSCAETASRSQPS